MVRVEYILEVYTNTLSFYSFKGAYTYLYVKSFSQARVTNLIIDMKRTKKAASS